MAPTLLILKPRLKHVWASRADSRRRRSCFSLGVEFTNYAWQPDLRPPWLRLLTYPPILRVAAEEISMKIRL
jgi:hypothetical protein